MIAAGGLAAAAAAARARASARRSTAPTSASTLGPLTFQPAEFAKIAIVVFLASYLRDTRQVLVQGARRVIGVTIPPLKHFGPLLVVWGAAMLMLVFIRDLGSSLMFFGGFLALLYVATNRLSFVVVGLGAVRARRVVLRHDGRPRAATASTSGCDPFDAARGTSKPERLPDRAVAVRAGRRRAVRHRASARRCSTRPSGAAAPARAADRPHLRGDRQRARAGRRAAGCSSSTCCSSSAGSRPRCSRATRSRSCWPPA